jgi:hypothetical protein
VNFTDSKVKYSTTVDTSGTNKIYAVLNEAVKNSGSPVDYEVLIGATDTTAIYALVNPADLVEANTPTYTIKLKAATENGAEIYTTTDAVLKSTVTVTATATESTSVAYVDSTGVLTVTSQGLETSASNATYKLLLSWDESGTTKYQFVDLDATQGSQTSATATLSGSDKLTWDREYTWYLLKYSGLQATGKASDSAAENTAATYDVNIVKTNTKVINPRTVLTSTGETGFDTTNGTYFQLKTNFAIDETQSVPTLTLAASGLTGGEVKMERRGDASTYQASFDSILNTSGVLSDIITKATSNNTTDVKYDTLTVKAWYGSGETDALTYDKTKQTEGTFELAATFTVNLPDSGNTNAQEYAKIKNKVISTGSLAPDSDTLYLIQRTSAKKNGSDWVYSLVANDDGNQSGSFTWKLDTAAVTLEDQVANQLEYFVLKVANNSTGTNELKWTVNVYKVVIDNT